MLTTRTTTNVAATALALGLIGAACGSDTPSVSSDLPTLEPSAAPATDTANSNAEASAGPMSEAEKTRVLEEYRDCYMADNIEGVLVEVSLDADGTPNINSEFDDIDETIANELEARCEPLLEPLIREFVGDTETVADRTDFSLVLQECLADRGFSFDIDPQTGFLIVSVDSEADVGQETNEIDDAALELAEQECTEVAEDETGFRAEGGG